MSQPNHQIPWLTKRNSRKIVNFLLDSTSMLGNGWLLRRIVREAGVSKAPFWASWPYQKALIYRKYVKPMSGPVRIGQEGNFFSTMDAGISVVLFNCRFSTNSNRWAIFLFFFFFFFPFHCLARHNFDICSIEFRFSLRSRSQQKFNYICFFVSSLMDASDDFVVNLDDWLVGWSEFSWFWFWRRFPHDAAPNPTKWFVARTGLKRIPDARLRIR